MKKEKPNPNYQDHLKYRFIANVANSKPCSKGKLCLEMFDIDRK